eukprot:TRINITY_DN3626_c0_g1_i3.p1 TRINITY_DN3626_c0_g1~~TRINITY_DN3626_c0_g1_i3.p1  ORF type:complete len:348 (+),score=68.91 TRINITY_DN3626_c0_g1_i3:77-1120(+)
MRPISSASSGVYDPRRPRLMVAAVLFTFVILYALTKKSGDANESATNTAPKQHSSGGDPQPRTPPPAKQIFHEKISPLPTDSFRFAIIADMDKASQAAGAWYSLLRTGVLRRNPDGKYSVTWEEEISLSTAINEGGRGLELSELVRFNGKLYTFDDRTGIMFEIVGDKVVPRTILMDGNGETSKGFKCEWATVKGDLLYVGSTGKEWSTPEGVMVNNNPQWVKTIDSEGHVAHYDWRNHYELMRLATGTSYPGYLIHESAYWHAKHAKWYFLPRRASAESYDDKLDEKRGTNIMLAISENFQMVKVTKIGVSTKQSTSVVLVITLLLNLVDSHQDRRHFRFVSKWCW